MLLVCYLYSIGMALVWRRGGIVTLYERRGIGFGIGFRFGALAVLYFHRIGFCPYWIDMVFCLGRGWNGIGMALVGIRMY